MLKLQYFGHLMQRSNSLEKTVMLGKIEGKKGTTEDEMVGWHHQDSMDIGFSKLRELVMLSNHLILCCPLLLLPSIFPSIQ